MPIVDPQTRTGRIGKLIEEYAGMSRQGAAFLYTHLEIAQACHDQAERAYQKAVSLIKAAVAEDKEQTHAS